MMISEKKASWQKSVKSEATVNIIFSIEASQEKNLKDSISKVTQQEQKTTDAANTFRQTKKFKDAVHYGKQSKIRNTGGIMKCPKKHVKEDFVM